MISEDFLPLVQHAAVESRWLFCHVTCGFQRIGTTYFLAWFSRAHLKMFGVDNKGCERTSHADTITLYPFAVV